MTPQRWRQIQELFHQLLTLPIGERQQALRDACGDDQDLEERVAAMLEADALAEAGDAAERMVADAVEALDPAPPKPPRFGPYRVIRQLGRGGMGTVFLAERDDGQFRQKVAVKLVHAGLEDEMILKRLRQERQILAALEHPHIARLFDGGVTDDGRPYFVMEYIRGEPLDLYCDRRQLPVRARLELFLKVCSAVHHAHQNLVLHRDLKPANLLVTDDGIPKLLDFGIAKLLDGEAPFTRAETLPGLRWLTPNFASPEQTRGEALSTSSDVYSLGVLLYLLLTGRLPTHLPRRGRDETVRDLQPLRPSAVVVRATDAKSQAAEDAAPNAEESPTQTPEAVARLRGEHPERLRRMLKGDLDTILLTALRQEPDRRYASVAQLAEDLRRHLEALPIRARPEKLGYRLGKFVQRHRLLVLATSLVTASLVAGLVTTTWQARRADRALGLARVQQQRAEQVIELLLEVMGQADPSQAVGHEITVREVLDRFPEIVATRLSDQPLDRALLLDTLGRAYLGLGLPAAAEPPLEEALELHRRHLNALDSRLADSLQHLAELRYAQGRYGDAEALELEALELQRKLFGDEDARVAETLSDLAALAEVLERVDDAKALYQQSLDTFRATVGERDVEYARALANRGILSFRLGDLAEAENYLRSALAVRRAVLPQAHPDLISNTADLAALAELQGRSAEAEALMRRGLETQIRVLGEDHPRVATSRHNLAAMLARRGQLEDAEAHYRTALASQRRRLDARHPRLAQSLNSLADVLMRRQHVVEAEALYRESLAIRRHSGAPPKELAVALVRLANAIARRSPEEAEALYRETLSLTGVEDPAQGVEKTRLWLALGRVVLRQARPAEAERYLRQSWQARRARNADDAIGIAEAAVALAQSLADQGRQTEARELVAGHLPALQSAWKPTDWRRTEAEALCQRLHPRDPARCRVAAPRQGSATQSTSPAKPPASPGAEISSQSP
ncbi:MAG: serine/threonine-protein kinase [Acidobacteriota bacterium]